MADKKKKTEEASTPKNDLAALIKATDKAHGAGIIRRGNAIQNLTYLPTDIFMVDMALLGGLPEGRMMLGYGNPSSGKSMLALKLAASAQRKYPDSKVLYINLETELDMNWAEAHGVDRERIFEAQPTSGEQAADIFHAAVTADDVNFIVMDSLANLVPMKEAESSAEDNHMALSARLQSRMFRNLRRIMTAEMKRGHMVSVYCINQFRTNVGQMFGDNRTLPGGSGQHFAADVKIELKNKEILEKNTGIVQHNEHNFVISKNKTGTSIRSGEFKVNRLPNAALPIGGIDDVETVIAYAKSFGMIDGAGQSWRYNEQKFGSLAAITQMFYDEPEKLVPLKKQLIGLHRRSMGLPALPPDNYL